MDDTPPKIKQLYDEMLLSKTPQDRLRMASRMYDSFRKLSMAELLNKRQEIAPSQLRAEIFSRIYGNDFSSADKDRIMQRILDSQQNYTPLEK
jgi:hypothetical protein